MKLTAKDIEYAIAKYINWRRNLIVPNVSWGLGFEHELDLAVVSKARYLKEIEIKVSLADLKADMNKKCWHVDKENRIKELWFAVPEELQEQALSILPETVGIYVVKGKKVREVREAKAIPKARPLTEKEMEKLYHLLSMRVWAMRKSAMKKVKNAK